MSRVLDVIAPPRMGRSFRWLLASSWVTNLGDGLALAAGPLLIAAQTTDPFLISLGALVQWLPPLVFGLLAGGLADRLDRRRLVIVVDLVRVAVLATLTAMILLDRVSIVLALALLFAGAVVEVFADTTSATLMPTLVARDDLALGNARLGTGFITMNQLAGPPLGAFLFAAGTVWPFAAQAVLVATGVLLVSRIVLPVSTDGPRPRRHLLAEIGEGFVWVRHHAAVRTLVLTIFIFNLTFGAAWSVLVLYARDRLGLGPVGFGLITTVGAVGGVLATLGYGWLTRRVSLGALMRIGLVVETLTHLGLALTTSPVIALSIFFVFGVHAFVWGTTAGTIRQRAVPTDLQGRVRSVYQLGVYLGLVIGAAIGGLLAREWGVTAPFWFAFAGSVVFVVAIWRSLRHVAHDPEPDPTG